MIPPSTLISTKPTILSDKPQWRTTLVYYISRQILHRLRKRQAQITLEVSSLTEQGSRDTIGSIVLQMDEAKMVLMRNGSRDISQVQQFVVDKGDWLSISENSRSKIKAGIFIVEMPSNTNATFKEVGTPLQIPVKTSFFNDTATSDLGLEICSDMSELFIDTLNDSNQEDSLILDDDEDEEDYEQDMMNMQLNENDDEEDIEQDVIPIGEGLDQYSFLFRIIEAKNIASIANKYASDVTAYFQYEFANKHFQCAAEYDQDHWQALEYVNNIMLQGHLDDITAWLTEQSMITVCLIIEDAEGKQEIVGFSEIYLKGRDIGVANQSSMIYDCERTWHINSDKQFSKLLLRIGLEKGWSELDDFTDKE